MPVQKELVQDNVKVRFFSDKEDAPLEIKVVVRNNNIYLETPKGLGEGSDAVELIDDHYKKISKDIYEDYEFDYDKLIDESFKPHYTSIFNLGTLLINGYKKIFFLFRHQKDPLTGVRFGFHVCNLCSQQYCWDYQRHR